MIHVFPVGKTATGIPTDLTGCPTDSPTAAVHKNDPASWSYLLTVSTGRPTYFPGPTGLTGHPTKKSIE